MNADPIVTTREFKSCALYFAYKHRSSYTRYCFVGYMCRISEKYREKMTNPIVTDHEATIQRIKRFALEHATAGVYDIFAHRMSLIATLRKRYDKKCQIQL